MPAPAQLTLSGAVYPSKQVVAGLGDVAIHPGSSRTPYIDATIFDGESWRALDLKGFGFGFGVGSRAFEHASRIGSLMRQIERAIVKRIGHPVYYEYPTGSKRRKYVYRGIPFSSVMQRPPRSSY